MKYTFTLLIVLFFSLNASAQNQQLENSPARNSRGNIQTITANIPYQGYDESQAYFGQGEYQVFLDTGDGILDQPIFIIGGFDPGDSQDIPGLYNRLSFNGVNLADTLRDEGYDIVIVNSPQYTTGGKFIDGGADYIQRNGLVLAAILEEINAQKVGDAQNVVIGTSMGGLVSQYALAYMEANSLPHETRLFISFDAPHRGANIPISLQYLLNYLAEQTGDPTAQQLISGALSSPAAKEMLVDHLQAHLLPGSNYLQDPTKLLPEGAPNFREAFQTEMDALGFPQNVRNVAMINGSGIGTTIGTPGMEVVNTNLEVDANTDIDVALYFTPVASETLTVTDVTVNFFNFPIDSFTADAQSTALSDGVDSAPGGRGNISAALSGGGGNPVLQDFIDALQQDSYSFIPTLSSLAIEADNWFALPNLNDSPFVNYHIPDTNQNHVTVTAENLQFALDEIRQVLGVEENTSASIVLLQNPVEGEIRIGLSQSSETVTTELYSITGGLIAQKEWNQPGNVLRWTQNLSSGMYVLSVLNGTQNQQFKVIVK